MGEKVLEQLRLAHMAIEKTKCRARATILWAQINQEIENMVKKCSTCQYSQGKQQREPMKANDVSQYPY